MRAIRVLTGLATLSALCLSPAIARDGFMGQKSFYPELIADVAEQVAPSVVNIDTEVQGASQGLPPGFENYFQQFFGFGFAPPGSNDGNGGSFKMYTPQPETISGNGSGVVIDTQGHILTNNHVVEGAQTISVTLQNGQKFPGTVVGRDRYSDIAILKINAPGAALKPATLGTSATLRPGEWVLAIGNPRQFDHTVTLGIISGLSRRIPDLNRNMEFIQTDAAINPGNSGGPLVNLNGEVIGINTAVANQRNAQNIGFAIPIDVVKSVSGTLLTTGQITRPYIGVAMATLDEPLAKSLGLSDNTEGVVISSVLPDSPAAQSGLKQGDVIQRIDGKSVSTAEAVQELIRTKPLNSAFNVQILRDGQMMGVSVTSRQLPDEPPATPAYRKFQR